MKMDFNEITRRFLLDEGKKDINPHALLQSLAEMLNNIKVSTQRDRNRLEVGKRQLKEIRNSYRKLQEQVNVLEEKLQVLEEVSAMGSGAVAGAAGNAFVDTLQKKKRSKKND